MKRYRNRNQGKDSTIEPAYIRQIIPESSGGGGGSTETVRYTIEKTIGEDGQTIYKLKQTINGETTYVGDTIDFAASQIIVGDGKTLEQVLIEIDEALARKTETYVEADNERIVFQP